MELEGDLAPLDENIWKRENIAQVGLLTSKSTDKLTTRQLISIIHEEPQLHKLTIMEPNIDTIDRWLKKFSINDTLMQQYKYRRYIPSP